MIINTEIIKSLEPCQYRFDNWLHHYETFNGTLEEFILLENITYSDKVWVVIRLFTKEQNVKWSLLCASKVLSIFESQYPEDKRPRKALEAVEVYLENPNATNAANAAAYAAYAANATNAANAATNATNAANAATNATNAANAATNATNAANAAAYAAYATNAADNAAAYAAYAAYAAAYAANAWTSEKKLEEDVNLLLMVECL